MEATLALGPMLMGLLGGLALFLFGMEQLTDALKLVAGESMKQVLAKLTANRFTAVIAGAVVTAVIQSSSVTTVLVVGFVSAGLLTLSQSIGVIMGANIGTTITAQIIAFKVTHYALLLVAVGFAFSFLARRERLRQYGVMTLGLGLIFLGMNLMSEATEPLRSFQPFIDLMAQMSNPLWGILLSATFTALVQSSSATTGIIIVLAGQGFISLEAGIALALGANLGTCATAILATVGKSRTAVQTALVHVLFNVLGILLWVGAVEQLADLVRLVSPTAPTLSGTDRLAAETPRQIANAHTIFNVVNTLVFIWFTQPMGRLVRYLLPDKPDPLADYQPRYLDEALFDTPDLALDRVRLELGHLGEHVTAMVDESLETVVTGSQADLARLGQADDVVDALYGSIVTYLGEVSQDDLLPSQSRLLASYMTVANHLENIGDMVETNLVDVGATRLQQQVQVSTNTQNILDQLHQKVNWSVRTAVESVVAGDLQQAQAVIRAKKEISGLAEEANRYLGRRLVADEPNRLVTFRLEAELVEYLKRVYYFAKRIAKETAGDIAEVQQEQGEAAFVD